MPNRRRLLWLIPILLLVAAVSYTAWLTWQVQGSLSDAEDSATQLQQAIDHQDARARDDAVASLRGKGGRRSRPHRRHLVEWR